MNYQLKRIRSNFIASVDIECSIEVSNQEIADLLSESFVAVARRIKGDGFSIKLDGLYFGEVASDDLNSDF